MSPENASNPEAEQKAVEMLGKVKLLTDQAYRHGYQLGYKDAYQRGFELGVAAAGGMTVETKAQA